MDMKALKRASDGNADQMIAVRKGLLADAYARIKALEGETKEPKPMKEIEESDI